MFVVQRDILCDSSISKLTGQNRKAREIFSAMRKTLHVERANDPLQFHALVVALLRAVSRLRPIRGLEPPPFPAYGLPEEFATVASRVEHRGLFWKEEHSQLLFAH